LLGGRAYTRLQDARKSPLVLPRSWPIRRTGTVTGRRAAAWWSARSFHLVAKSALTRVRRGVSCPS